MTKFDVGALIENRYRVLDVIDSGGMGILYRVSDEARDGEIIVLKTMRLGKAAEEASERVGRFQREFQLLIQLSHPNLVSVYDYGITVEGELYFTMEWVQGRNLEPSLSSLEPGVTIPVMVQVCRALVYLHARGVIHGDLKPQNVLMTGDGRHRVKLVDFGVAHKVRSPKDRARYYTLGYTSPEMRQPDPVDRRADLYSLGATWYALLVGEPPMFMPGTGKERLIRFALDEALESQDQIPKAIGTVIARLMATSPGDRYGSANEVIEAVNEITGSAYELETRETAASYALRTHFVGREAELDALQTAWEQAQENKGKVVLISGESGVGKTRLVTELEVQAELAGARVVWGQCVERGGDAYQPWREVLRVLVRYVESADETAIQQVGPVLAGLLPQLWDRDYMAGLVPPADLEPHAAQLRLNDAIMKVMRVAAELRPTMIVVENAHWADEATLDLLRYLARVPGAVGLLVCVTYRDDGVDSEHLLETLTGERVQRVRIHRLSPEMTTDFVRAMLGLGQLPALLSERVQRTTGGNAFFVQELIRSLAAEGKVLRRTVEGWQVDGEALQKAQLPESIRQVIKRRLSQLSEGAQQVLEWAAVVGLAFWEEVVAEVGKVARAQVRAALGELLEQELVASRDETSFVGEQEYLFLNPTVREMSYESIPQDERRECHRRVAAWLMTRSSEEINEHLGLIADHLEQAGRIKQAATYLTQAGEQAAAQFANAEAVVYFNRALDLIPEDNLTEHYALLLAREGVYDIQGAREAQHQDLAALQEVAEALADDRRRAEVTLRWSYYLEVTGDYSAAIELAQTVIELAQAVQDVSMEASGCLWWGRILWQQGKYKAAHIQLEQALILSQAAGLRRVEADSLHNLGILFAYLDDYARAKSWWEQGLSIYREIGHRHGEGLALSNIGEIWVREGDYTAARNYFEQSLHIFREIGYLASEGYVFGNLGLVYMRLGDYVRATTYIEQALRLCRETGYRRGEITEMVYLGLLSYQMGDDEAAREYSQQALLVTQDIGERDLQGRALTTLGHILMRQGCRVKAAESYRQALALQQESGQHALAMESLAGLARVFLAKGELTQALAQVEEILHHLDQGNTLAGTEEPFRVYVTCYHVLRANQNSRAEDILRTAHCLLQEQAVKIGDEEMRRSFLKNVAVHRAIVSEWANLS